MARPASATAFEAWADAHGVQRSVKACTTDCGLAVRARLALAPGQVAIAVPEALLLTASHARGTDLGLKLHTAVLEGHLLAEEESAGKVDELCLLMHLLALVRSAPAEWKPYIDMLPKYYHSPLSLSREEEMDLIDNTALQGTSLQYIVPSLRESLRELAREAIAIAGWADVSEDSFIWAYLTVSSRGFRVLIDGHEELLLAPYACLCNHEPRGVLTSKRYNGQTKCLELTAGRSCAAGEEVSLVYSESMPAWSTLLFYGFVPRYAAAHEYALYLDVMDDEHVSMDHEVRVHLLLRCAATLSLEISLMGDEIFEHKRLPQQLLPTLRLLLAKYVDLEGITAQNVDAVLSQQLSHENEAASLAFAQRTLASLLSTFATLPEKPPMNSDVETIYDACVAYREGQRSLLKGAMDLVEQQQALLPSVDANLL